MITAIGANEVIRLSKINEITDHLGMLQTPMSTSFPDGNVGGLPGASFGNVLVSVSSSTWVDLPYYSVTVQSRGKRLFVGADFYIGILANNVAEIQLLVDSVAVTNSQLKVSGGTLGITGCIMFYSFIAPTVTKGTHTVKLQVRRFSGTGTADFYKLPKQFTFVRDY